MLRIDRLPSTTLYTLMAALGVGQWLAGQCPLQVAPAAPAVGITGPAWTSRLWDPDGAGPAPAVLVVGGEFAVAGGALANGLGVQDLTTGQWSGLGAGPGLRVLAAAVLGNGQLAVAGMRPAVATTSVLAWNGASWAQVGGTFALNGQVVIEALATRPNGDLVAVGNFTTAGGAPDAHVARYDGSAWQPLGSGLDAQALALAVLPNGDVVVGGTFATAGGIASPFAARWDGAAWQPMSAGLAAWVNALHVRGNGELVASSNGDVLRWTGAAWVPLGPAPGFAVYTFAETATGQLLAGGDTLGAVRVWTGSAWAPFTTATGRIQETLTPLPNGHLIAGGTFGLRRWTGASWVPLSASTGPVQALAATRDGGMIAGGYFASGASSTLAARWNGGSWQPLPGLQGLAPRAVVQAPGGELLAAIDTSWGTRSTFVWRGAAWSFAPGGDGITCFASAADGVVLGAVGNGILRWNGSGWDPLVGGITGSANRMVVLSDASIVVAGALDLGGGPAERVARWNGQTWTVLAHVWAGALVDAGGELVVGGAFATIGGVPAQNVARFDGANWNAIGAGVPGPVRDLAVLPDGDLVAATSFAGVWRARGAAWSVLAVADGHLDELELGSDGLFAAGPFAVFAGAPSPGYARLVTPCPATVAAAGAGCAASAGPVELRVVEAAWLGGTLRTEVTGLTVNTVALAVWGLAPIVVPLPALLPVGLPGCTLWVAPDLLAASLPTNGRAASSLVVPDVPALIGATLRHQVVALELAFAGGFAAASASNARVFTLGDF
jgi:hypothetical protein